MKTGAAPNGRAGSALRSGAASPPANDCQSAPIATQTLRSRRDKECAYSQRRTRSARVPPIVSPNPTAPSAPVPATDAPPPAPGESTAEALRRLEERVARLETYIGLPLREEATAGAMAGGGPAEPELESEIGEFWLARVGVVALIVGLAFIVVYPLRGWPAWAPSAIGYAATAGLLLLARAWERGLPDTARIVFNGALFLLFFATLRLHYFSAAPAIGSRFVALVLIVAVLAAQFAIAVRRGSEGTAALATALLVALAVVSDGGNLSLACLAAAAVATVALYWKLHWWRLQLAAVPVVFAAHLHWLLGNPLAGHPMRGVADGRLNLLFLLIEGSAFIAAGLIRNQSDEPAFLRIVRAVLTGGGLIVLGLLNAKMFHSAQPPWVQVLLTVVFLGGATAYWHHHRGRFGTAIYACFGYLALSAGIIAWFRSPEVFSWLAWQSLLVAATAVWFCSKIVIVANLFIFGGIYLTYLALAPAAGGVNLSFAIVALLIARILNWQKERLNVHTELMRNTYLAAATVIIPYGLYHTVPKSLVSTSWLLASAGYFIASLMLGSRKYRWMAIATIFATILYVFIVDFSRLEPAYRIVSFLVLGVGLLAFSIYYARQRTKRDAQGE